MNRFILTFAAIAITAGAWAGKTPVAKAVPESYIDVTPAYFKFYKGATDLNAMLRSDLESPGNPSLGNQNFITTNYGSTADKYFNATNLSKGNVMFGGPFGRVNQQIVKAGMSLYDMGDEIGTVLILNGKNSKLAEALKDFQGLSSAPEIPKLESFTGNIQLFWILDHVTMNQKVPTGSNIFVRLVLNGYNNDMSSTKEVINYLDKVDEGGNENLLDKKVKVTFDEFADTDNSWNPNLWMVYDVEMPYNRMASYFRTLLNQGTSGLDDGALLIRSIEIYGLPSGTSSGLTPELVSKSWINYSGDEEEQPEDPGENEDPSQPGQDEEYTGTYDSERGLGVVNHALQFTAKAYVECGQMPTLNNLASYSVQFWIKPTVWTEGASILSRGDKWSVELGKEGKVVVNSGNSKLEVASDALKTGKWSQITVINNNGNVTALVNGAAAGTGTLAPIPEESAEFIMGGGYEGLLDEVRVWNAALNDEMKTFDYFTNNTVNKWCPMWENLIAYYKMDQENSNYVVEYKALENPDVAYDNHGVINGEIATVDSNNSNLPYLVNAAYTENIRFFDRIIPRDQYLLSNEVIILGADCVGATGNVVTRTPNNHATVGNGVSYLSTFEGREGVVSLDGSSASSVVAPALTWNNKNNYGFETWIYLDEWTPGAYLFRKEADTTHGVSLRLGNDASKPTLIARINGKEYVSQAFNLPVKQWTHVGFAPSTGGSVLRAVMFFLNGTGIRADISASTTEYDLVPEGNENQPIYIGEGLKAKLDETACWNKNLVASDITKHMTNMPMPSLTKNVNVIEITDCSAYYTYNNSDQLGYSSHSQDEWANIMRSAYVGYTPAKFTISVRGHDAASASDNFTSIINNAQKRKVFAADLAEISKNYDGVELDLEWIYTWDNYSLLADEIVKALPEGKTFRISTHNVSYSYPKAKILDPGITGFTFQQYGPQRSHFNYVDGFTNYVQYFLNYGYPADKILTSYSTTTSSGSNGGDILGVRNGILAQYEPNDANVDSYTSNGQTWYYMGPMQVYKRAKYTRDLNLQGIFYWDMGNDYWEGTAAAPVMPKYNSAKYCSYGLNSNIDPVAPADLVANHFGSQTEVESIVKEDVTKGINVYPSPAESEITVTIYGNEIPAELNVYSMSGQMMVEGKDTNTLQVANLSSGIYMLTATSKDGKRYKTKFIKR